MGFHYSLDLCFWDSRLVVYERGLGQAASSVGQMFTQWFFPSSPTKVSFLWHGGIVCKNSELAWTGVVGGDPTEGRARLMSLCSKNKRKAILGDPVSLVYFRVERTVLAQEVQGACAQLSEDPLPAPSH